MNRMDCKRIKKQFLILSILLAYLTAGFKGSYALAANDMDEVPYNTYTYDKWGNANPAPNGYLPDKSIRGADYGIGEFSSPEDLFYCKEREEVYIADTGNQRIVVTDKNFEIIRIIDEFTYQGKSYAMSKPTGIFVDKDGVMYIADQSLGVIIKSDAELNIITLFGKPESNLITEDFEYKPNKVVVDSYGKIYVQAVGVFQGLINLRADGTFIKYYGANKVEMTLKRIADKAWRSLLSDTASKSMQAFNPIEYGNIFYAANDFLYATAAATENNSQLIVKLNPLGIDIFKSGLQLRLVSSFADVTVDEDDIMTVIDSKTGMIYQLDKTGKLMFAFGGIGNQLGLLKRPVAIIEIEDKIYVMDGDKDDITRYMLTAFGVKVREAINLYNMGLYQESIKPWMEVIKLNANYLLAYTGLGKAYYQIENYEEAMRYYKLANDKANYSLAYKEYSLYVMRDNFGRILAVILILIILHRAVKVFYKKRKKPYLGQLEA